MIFSLTNEVMAADNFVITGINYILNYIKIENSYFNYNNILQYYHY